jgi:hypothetical protein
MTSITPGIPRIQKMEWLIVFVKAHKQAFSFQNILEDFMVREFTQFAAKVLIA